MGACETDQKGLWTPRLAYHRDRWLLPRADAKLVVWEHTFVTSQGSASARFQRAIQGRHLFQAEIAAFEMTTLSLEDALALVVLYAETEDEKFERAGIRWLGRLLLERPMNIAVAAQSVELVAKLRGPGLSGQQERS